MSYLVLLANIRLGFKKLPKYKHPKLSLCRQKQRKWFNDINTWPPVGQFHKNVYSGYLWRFKFRFCWVSGVTARAVL